MHVYVVEIRTRLIHRSIHPALSRVSQSTALCWTPAANARLVYRTFLLVVYL